MSRNAKEKDSVEDEQEVEDSALERILAAQQGKLFANHQMPLYSDALSEIRRGRKSSCWMWYIWPSLKAVRKHRMPNLLLADLAEAQEYLRHKTLGSRLVHITNRANERLDSGVPNRVLFGGGLDSMKFHESCTVFAVAALANGDEKSAAVFAKAVAFYGSINAAAVRALLDNDGSAKKLGLEGGLDIGSSLRQVMQLAKENR